MEKLTEYLEKCELNIRLSEEDEEVVFLNDDKSVSRKLLAPVVCGFF